MPRTGHGRKKALKEEDEKQKQSSLASLPLFSFLVLSFLCLVLSFFLSFLPFHLGAHIQREYGGVRGPSRGRGREATEIEPASPEDEKTNKQTNKHGKKEKPVRSNQKEVKAAEAWQRRSQQDYIGEQTNKQRTLLLFGLTCGCVHSLQFEGRACHRARGRTRAQQAARKGESGEGGARREDTVT